MLIKKVAYQERGDRTLGLYWPGLDPQASRGSYAVD
jgi:hypothetical protein